MQSQLFPDMKGCKSRIKPPDGNIFPFLYFLWNPLLNRKENCLFSKFPHKCFSWQLNTNCIFGENYLNFLSLLLECVRKKKYEKNATYGVFLEFFSVKMLVIWASRIMACTSSLSPDKFENINLISFFSIKIIIKATVPVWDCPDLDSTFKKSRSGSLPFIKIIFWSRPDSDLDLTFKKSRSGSLPFKKILFSSRPDSDPTPTV